MTIDFDFSSDLSALEQYELYRADMKVQDKSVQMLPIDQWIKLSIFGELHQPSRTSRAIARLGGGWAIAHALAYLVFAIPAMLYAVPKLWGNLNGELPGHTFTDGDFAYGVTWAYPLFIVMLVIFVGLSLIFAETEHIFWLCASWFVAIVVSSIVAASLTSHYDSNNPVTHGIRQEFLDSECRANYVRSNDADGSGVVEYENISTGGSFTHSFETNPISDVIVFHTPLGPRTQADLIQTNC